MHRCAIGRFRRIVYQSRSHWPPFCWICWSNSSFRIWWRNFRWNCICCRWVWFIAFFATRNDIASVWCIRGRSCGRQWLVYWNISLRKNQIWSKNATFFIWPYKSWTFSICSSRTATHSWPRPTATTNCTTNWIARRRCSPNCMRWVSENAIIWSNMILSFPKLLRFSVAIHAYLGLWVQRRRPQTHEFFG